MSRNRTMALAVAGLLACLASTFDVARAEAGQPLMVKSAVYQAGDGVNGGASVRQVRHRYGGYGYGPGYGYGGYGWGSAVYQPIYRPYPSYAAPVVAPPMYGPPVYGYPAYNYPGYGYSYGYRPGLFCW